MSIKNLRMQQKSSKNGKKNKKPVMLGGEHLVTLPAVSSLYEKYNDLVVLHFDAHTDLRTDYMGEELSHATVIKQIWNFLGDNRLFIIID